jgi:uncharacterized protein YndB with AHSA1/START domain
VTAQEGFAVELEHRVMGPPETVFTYFTDPSKHRRWMGAEVELDPRPGGLYRVTTAPGIAACGEYVVVEPPHRLVMTWGWEAVVQLPTGIGEVAPGASAVEFRFVPDGDGTIIRVRHLALPSEEACWAHELGWNSYLPRLIAAVEGRDPGEDPIAAIAAAYLERDAGRPTG